MLRQAQHDSPEFSGLCIPPRRSRGVTLSLTKGLVANFQSLLSQGISLFIAFYSVSSFALAQTQTVKPIGPKELAQIIASKKDSVVVLNFWATWCKPCVAELPFFEQLYQTHRGQKVSIILVSLDDPADNQRLVTPFVRKRNMHTEVYQMTEPNPNVWINDFEPNWSGAIPVTLFYADGKKVQFHNGEITSNELTDTVDKLLRGERKND